jgi:hypothetical protein
MKDLDDQAIRDLVTRLARPHPSGGRVIERAAIFAEGAESGQVIAWIIAHAGQPETRSSSSRGGGGLHGSRLSSGGDADSETPVRFVLPAGTLT